MARLLLFSLALQLVSLLPAQEKPTRDETRARRLVLWYRQPAKTWNEALPVGNGRLGGMVFGGTDTERIQLNEETIWAGEARDRNNPLGAGSLADVRRLLFAGKPVEAESLAQRTMIAVPKRMPPYQPLGDLVMDFPGHAKVTEYRRELDLDSGVVRVRYRVFSQRVPPQRTRRNRPDSRAQGGDRPVRTRWEDEDPLAVSRYLTGESSRCEVGIGSLRMAKFAILK